MKNQNIPQEPRFPVFCAVRFLSVLELCAAGAFLLCRCDGGPGLLSRLLLLCGGGAAVLLLFTPVAGGLAEYLPKRSGVVLGALGELLVLAGGLLLLRGGAGMAGAAVFVLLLAGAFSLIQPALSGLAAELWPERELSLRDAILHCWWMAGIAAGTGIGFYTARHTSSLPAGMALLLLMALLNFVLALRLPLTVPPRRGPEDRRGIWRGAFGELRRKSSHWYAVIGCGLTLNLGLVMLPLLLWWSHTRLQLHGVPSELLLLSAPAFGVMLGALAAGFLSRCKIEMGLVPFGTAAIAAGFLPALCFPGTGGTLLLETPWTGLPLHLTVYPAVSCWLLLGGFGAGLLLIPLQAYCQSRFRGEVRGGTLAVKQGAAALIFLLAAVPPALFMLYVPEMIPAAFPGWIIGGLSLTAVLLTLLSMYFQPDMLLRFITITLGRTIYRVRVSGAENIPEQGGALLVANHVSLIDSVLISLSTSRRIRFLMREDLLGTPVIRLLTRFTGFIVVPATGSRRLREFVASVREALCRGDIICAFPEGSPTVNSLVGAFSNGITRLLPPGRNIPVIPVAVGGMWGSRYSLARAKIGHRLALRSPRTASVFIGAPMPPGVTAFQIRQEITRLFAVSAEEHLYPGERPLHTMFAENAKAHPFRTVLIDADGKTFSAFKTFLASLLLSRELRRLAPDETYVGILLPNCSGAALSVLAVLFADKIPCPLNFTTPSEVFQRTLAKAGINRIITSRKFLDKIALKPAPEQCLFLEDLASGIPLWRKIGFFLNVLCLPASELLAVFSPRSCNDSFRTATVLFSSGTTGDPKGVLLSHHNIFSDIQALTELTGFQPDTDCFLGNLPLFHSFGLTVCLWIPLITGSRSTFLPNPLDSAAVGKLIARDRITMFFATPTFLQAYMRKCTPEQFRTLRLAVTGAERLRSEISEQFAALCGGRIVVTEGYGCTELSPVVSLNVPDDITQMGRGNGKAGSIGAALSCLTVKIVDPITFRELPPESEGLLFVRGPIVMGGYLNDPEKTAKAMFDGFYNTGDVATMSEDGRITICGRLSRFSKISGEMVPHEMVESIINELCGGGAPVVAVGSIPDARKGEALAVLYTPAMSLTPDEVVAELRERSISNLWIPKAVNFYPVPELPYLGSGKLDLMKLKQILAEITAG